MTNASFSWALTGISAAGWEFNAALSAGGWGNSINAVDMVN
jgi:hypothetical protein